MCNCIEMFERLAYFGIRAVVPIYIMQATEPGGLHLTAVHKGWIYMWWAVLQSWLPMFTGGIADRYGYKRTLVFAISANIIGYVMMALFHSYYGFFAGILVLATGTAFFKPALQGSIAQNLDKANASMGWGIFYWVVNVGAVMAPVLATIILGQPHSALGWRNLFLASAIYTAVNLLLLLTFRDVPSGADKTTSLKKVFALTVENIWPFWFRGGTLHPGRAILGAALCVAGLVIIIFKPLGMVQWQELLLGLAVLGIGGNVVVWLRDGHFQWQPRLAIFLLIMSCFWLMMYQLWDLHPNFIEDWIDSSAVAAHMPFDTWREYGPRGLIRVPQQILLNLNAALIVLLIVPISWLVRKMRTLSAMLIGMAVATAGILVAGLSGSGWFLLLGIVLFSLGEMLTGPKKNQYLGLIAPPGKKGLFLGYVNIPVGVGVGLGSIIAGFVYDHYGEKATLALKELAQDQRLVAAACRSIDWSDQLDKVAALTAIQPEQALESARRHYGQDADSTTRMLRQAFADDRGQIVNLALQALALRPEYTESAARHLGLPLTKAVVARHLAALPQALGISRIDAFDVLRELSNKQRQQPRSDSEITTWLWSEFGSDTQTLNNLALEYVAQATDALHDAILHLNFESSDRQQRLRIQEIEQRVGIGRTKSFLALSAARGAGEEQVRTALSGLPMKMEDADLDQRLYAFLMSQPHHRFIAVGRKDWQRDVPLLQELIASDPDALRVARAALGSGADGVDFQALASQQTLVQSALAAKDWTARPLQARRVLQINPFEARAAVAADLAHSPVTTTQLLWDKYSPQYHVWIPFAAIGVVAIIALAIFGQMAKKWKDMNA